MRHTDSPNIVTYLHEAMACEFAFYLYGERTALMDTAVSDAEEILDRLEERLSLYIENSDTNRINRAKTGEVIRVSEETVDCLLQAFDASARLQGKFHPFMGQSALKSKRQQNEVSRFVPIADAENESQEATLALDPDENLVQKLREGPLLDFGGIGKGFALDLIAAHFREWGFSVGLLESAGSAYLAMDLPENESAWELSVGYEMNMRLAELSPGHALASSGSLFQGAHVVDPEASDSLPD